MPYGKDGTYYNEWKEMKRANEKWTQQDRQNRLIEEQNKIKQKELLMREKENKLLQEQNILLKRQEEQQRLQNEELKRHNEEIERQNRKLEDIPPIYDDIDNHTAKDNELKIQQFNMSQDNIEKYIDRGMMYLEDEEYEQANKFFEMVLDINPRNAQAHLGKFLASQNTSSLDNLQNYAIMDLESSNDFLRALKYSEGEDKDILQKFLENNKLKIEQLENEEQENMQKLQELCIKLEENYINTQKENLEIAQDLFNNVQEEIQRNKINIHELETQILELQRKLNSLGFFKAKEKENINNEIENSKVKIVEIQKINDNLKQKYKLEIKKLYEQEENNIKELKELANDPNIGEQISLLLNNLGISTDDDYVEDDNYEDDDEKDPILNEAIEEVIKSGFASVSQIQSKLKIGFSRAGRIIDKMEEMGIISENQGSKPREVLISKEKWIEIKENNQYGRFTDIIKKLNEI